ncbi:MAG: sulfite exporter TauE/SafE family protein [Chloroflexota bacterium]
MTAIILPVLAGAAVGFLIGLTGMGGGALMTPFLILVMGVDPVLAVGTDLVFAAVTKIMGGIQHHRENHISLRRVLWMAVGSIPASILGAQFILRQAGDRLLVERTLPTILGVVLIAVSLILLARSFRWLGPKDEAVEARWPAPWALVSIGAVGGALVGMTSIGGGTVIMALLLVFFSIPLNFMVGLDVLHGALLAVVTSFNYAVAGQTDWLLVGLLLTGSIPGAWLGARLINRIDLRIVRGILALLILLAGIDLLR